MMIETVIEQLNILICVFIQSQLHFIVQLQFLPAHNASFGCAVGTPPIFPISAIYQKLLKLFLVCKQYNHKLNLVSVGG